MSPWVWAIPLWWDIFCLTCQKHPGIICEREGKLPILTQRPWITGSQLNTSYSFLMVIYWQSRCAFTWSHLGPVCCMFVGLNQRCVCWHQIRSSDWGLTLFLDEAQPLMTMRTLDHEAQEVLLARPSLHTSAHSVGPDSPWPGKFLGSMLKWSRLHWMQSRWSFLFLKLLGSFVSICHALGEAASAQLCGWFSVVPASSWDLLVCRMLGHGSLEVQLSGVYWLLSDVMKD